LLQELITYTVAYQLHALHDIQLGSGDIGSAFLARGASRVVHASSP
jgi:hypothetical protein